MYYVQGISTRREFGFYELRSVPVDRIDDYTSQHLAEAPRTHVRRAILAIWLR